MLDSKHIVKQIIDGVLVVGISPKEEPLPCQTPPRISARVELEATMSTVHPPETQFNNVLQFTCLGKAAASGYVYNTCRLLTIQPTLSQYVRYPNKWLNRICVKENCVPSKYICKCYMLIVKMIYKNMFSLSMNSP